MDGIAVKIWQNAATMYAFTPKDKHTLTKQAAFLAVHLEEMSTLW